MDDSIQQALFGGNISGRRLRGVKINPIYQENDPAFRDGVTGDTQSESALPIGEIQIEVYESLPRNCQWSYRPHNSAPAIPSPNHRPSLDSCLREKDCAQSSQEQVCSASEERGREDAAGGCEHRERWGVRGGEGKDGRSPVKGAMGVDSLPWTFLQGRSPAKREPVWSAFIEHESGRLPRLREDGEECLVVCKLPLEASSSSSSESQQVISSLENMEISSEDENDVGVNALDVVQSTGKGQQPGDNSSSTEHGDKHKMPDNKSFTNTASEYQAYFVTRDVAPDLSTLLTHGPFPYNTFHSDEKRSKGGNGFSNFVNFCRHNHDCISELCPAKSCGEGKNGMKSPSNNYWTLFQYHSGGENGAKIKRVISPEDGHVLCTCLCHTEPPVNGVRCTASGSILKDGVGRVENSETIESRNDVNSQESVPSREDSGDSEKTAESPSRQEPPNIMENCREALVLQGNQTTPEKHTHSEDCLMDFENNNNCLVLYKVRKEDLKIEDSVSVGGEGKSLSSCHDGDQNRDTSDSFSDGTDNSKHICPVDNSVSTSSKDSTDEIAKKDSSDDSQVRDTGDSTQEHDLTEPVVDKSEHNVCKLCGCQKTDQSNHRSKVYDPMEPSCLADGRMTSEMKPPYLHTPNDVTALLSSDSLLLRAQELNAPAYLQRYLMEAQRNYLQQSQGRQILHDDFINTETPSAFPSSGDDLGVTYHSTDLIVPDTGELKADYGQYDDSISYVEEIGCCPMRGKDSFKKTSSSSRAGSGKNSRNSSRQSSRNSRTSKPCSIEDVEAAAEEEIEEEGEQGLGLHTRDSMRRGISMVSRNASLKNGGPSVINVGGTVSDPALEMIVPYEEDVEQGSKYSSRRRQRLEEMAEESEWKEEPAPLKDRILKAVVCSFLLCVFIGIFIGVAIHFSKESTDDESDIGSGLRSSGSAYGMSS